MRRAIIPLLVVCLIVVAIQLSVFSNLRFAGVVIMLVWLLPIAVGLTGATTLAIGTGVLVGLLFDAHTITVFGLTAIVGGVLGYAVSPLGREGVGDLDSAAWWVTPLIASVGGFLAPLAYMICAEATGQFNVWRDSVISMMIVNAIAFFIFARPMARLARVIVGEGSRR